LIAGDIFSVVKVRIPNAIRAKELCKIILCRLGLGLSFLGGRSVEVSTAVMLEPVLLMPEFTSMLEVRNQFFGGRYESNGGEFFF